MRAEFANSGQTLTEHSADYRKNVRHRMSPMTYVEIGTENGGLLLDLSEGGLGLQAAHVLPIARAVPVRFRLPHSGRMIEGEAEVVWFGISQKQAGVRFVKLPEAARAAIQEWIAREACEELSELELEAEAPLKPRSDHETGAGASKEIFSPSLAGHVAEPEVHADEPKPTVPPVTGELNAKPSATPAQFEPEEPQAEATEPSLPSYRLNETSLFGGEAQVPYPLPVSARRRGPSSIWGLLCMVAVTCAFILGAAVGTGKLILGGYAAAVVESLGWQQPPQPPAPRIPGDVVVAFASLPATPPATASSQTTSAPYDGSVVAGANPQENAFAPNSAGGGVSRRDASGGEPKPNRTEMRTRSAVPSYFDKSFDNGRGKQPDHHSVLVRAPGRGSMPLLLSLPERTVLASQSLAITSRRAVEIAPIENASLSSRPQRVTVGRLLFNPTPALDGQDIESESGSVEILATIGLGGQVLETKVVGGSPKFGAAAMRAIREWLYEPTLVDGRPVASQDDLRFVFGRP